MKSFLSRTTIALCGLLGLETKEPAPVVPAILLIVGVLIYLVRCCLW